MAELSMDRKEFARLCAIEIQKAAKLSGGRLPDADFVRVMSMDMAGSQALSMVPCSRVPELFSIARAHYAETPVLRHLVKAWDNHMRPESSAPAPKDAPRLPSPGLHNSEARMRHLAAVRTSLAMGKTFQGCEAEAWMDQLLKTDPSREEVQAMVSASTQNSLAYYERCPDIPPFWGHWMLHYGIKSGESNVAN